MGTILVGLGALFSGNIANFLTMANIMQFISLFNMIPLKLYPLSIREYINA